MFITCFDFVKAGLHKHEDCCQRCHDTATSYIRPIVPERYRDIQYYCCCTFSGRSFTSEEMERVLQGAYKGG